MPDKGKIYISEYDLKRLKELIKVAESLAIKGLSDISRNWPKSWIGRNQRIPNDVITMNSRFRLRDVDTDQEAVYTLVFPGDADSASGKISILAPIGTAVLGYKIGDTIEWEVPAGRKRFKVEEIVYQPEAAGDYHR
jgi:regulator of nucleoside diphosphate kinase